MVESKEPVLSVIVIGYKMAAQLANTLFTLSVPYQQGVSESDYEIIAVENASTDNFDEETLSSLGSNIRFFRREETAHTPVPAINFAFSKCRGRIIGLMIDGARMLTPRVIQYVLMAEKLSENSLIVVPGYQLGEQVQHLNVSNGYDEISEKELLDTIAWRENGYELFSVSSISWANERGYFQPMMECNCLFSSADNFENIGYADKRFDLRGGGSINLHIFRSLGLLEDNLFVILPGEGSFHQFHGGVTTSEYSDWTTAVTSHSKQLQSIWNNEFHGLRREPVLLGAVTHWAQSFLQFSSAKSEMRFNRMLNKGLPLWEDDLSKVITDK